MTQTVNLALAGITCASCVKHITEALLGVPGVTQAEVNFAERTATAEGDLEIPELIKAIEDAGYSAREIVDPAAEEEARLIEENAHARELIRSTWIALAIGIPLMGIDLFWAEAMNLGDAEVRNSWLGSGLRGLIDKRNRFQRFWLYVISTLNITDNKAHPF